MAYDKGVHSFGQEEDDLWLDRAFSGQNTRDFNPFTSPDVSERDDLQSMKQASAARQLDTTRRIVASINESERVGVATAEELIQQGEQLDSIERNADHINQSMKTSQIHLNNVKSVFGGLKNWWQGRKSEGAKAGSTERQSKEQHPSDGVDDRDDSLLVHRSGPLAQSMQASAETAASFQEPQLQRQVPAAYETQLNNDLGAMSSGLSRLRGLALGLGDEMDRQDEQLDRIDPKLERANIILKDQNRQMGHILKK